ncbi:MAG TPA: hypothetical protein VFV49_00625 [Thermoanaerobaculia bacterium]|nr:hypothetical protein [Thermoanaerobaculia bacterium]
MKPRFVVPAFCALILVALFSFAKEPRWYQQPGTPVTLESSGFELRAMLPQGWTFTAEQGLVPPLEFASSCRVRGGFYTDRNWDRFLVSALRSTDSVLTAEEARFVLKIGGHPAVSNRYVREPFTVRDIYIDLSDLQPDSGAVWTFEGSPTPERSDCELQFLALIQSARITRLRSPR